MRAYHRGWQRDRYLQRIAGGRCGRCGKLTTNGARCVVCAEVHRAARTGTWDATARQQRTISRQTLQEERRQAGLCPICGEKYAGEFVRCRRCRTRERTRPSYLRRGLEGAKAVDDGSTATTAAPSHLAFNSSKDAIAVALDNDRQCGGEERNEHAALH